MFDLSTPGVLATPPKKPSIIDRVLERIYPSGAYGQFLSPEVLADERRMSLRKAGLGLMAAGGPRPQGTRNIGADIASALDPSACEEQLAQTAQTGMQLSAMQKKLQDDEAAEVILARHPVLANETPAQYEQRLRRLSSEFAAAGLWDHAKVAGQLISEVRPADLKSGEPGAVLYEGATGDVAGTLPGGAATGMVEQDKMFGRFLQQTGQEREIALHYNAVLTAGNTQAGDMSLIFAFMKMLDPGSVIRESEYATAENAANVPDRIRGLYNRLLTNKGRLEKGQREEFISQAHARARGVRSSLRGVIDEYQRRARAVQLDPDAVVFDYFRTMKTPDAITPAPWEEN